MESCKNMSERQISAEKPPKTQFEAESCITSALLIAQKKNVSSWIQEAGLSANVLSPLR